MVRLVSAAFALVSIALLGCGNGGGPVCRVGADCASGMCRADGTCVPVVVDAGPGADVDGGDGTDAGARDAGRASDGGGERDAGDRDAGGIVCAPDRNGTITRAEVPIAAGLRATFRIARDAMWSTAGEMRGGERVWDLSTALSGDHDALVETLSPEGQWWAPRFAGATYAARLADDSDLLGVFEVTGDALLLRGVVSPADGAARTELAYDPAVTVLRFPLASGGTWTTTSTVSGVASGVPGAYTERYDSQVDGSGTLITPFGEFPVLRVRVVLTRTVGIVVTTIRSFAFVTECFGTVASVRSRDNETAAEFTRAAEARRLAP